MQKIPTVFVRDWDGDPNYVTDTPDPLCDWVFRGEGDVHRKFDGTCVMLDENGDWWARREVKPGKTPPPNWKPVERDDHTGKAMGWEPIRQSGWKVWLCEAIADEPTSTRNGMLPGGAGGFTPGTYELCGPKIMGNPEGLGRHRLFKHGEERRFPFVVRTRDYAGIRDALAICKSNGWEGLVFHHPDGRMAKIKVRDFNWPPAIPENILAEDLMVAIDALGIDTRRVNVVTVSIDKDVVVFGTCETPQDIPEYTAVPVVVTRDPYPMSDKEWLEKWWQSQGDNPEQGT